MTMPETDRFADMTTDTWRRMLQQVIEQERNLTSFGYGVYNEQHLTAEQWRPEMAKERAALLAAADDGFARAYRWLSPKGRLLHVNRAHSSYFWKHRAEKDIGYITNGEFIAAAIAADFKVVRIQGSPNAILNLPSRYAKTPAKTP